MRLFGLTGYPLEHSLSKVYFDRKFSEENLHDCCYELFPAAGPDMVKKIIAEHPALEGLNVTIPLKKTIRKILDNESDEAGSIGAVNCIHITSVGGKPFVTGYNTDAAAFRLTLIPLLKPIHKKALILGTGGAALSAGYALKQLGIPYRFVSRQAGDGNLLYDDLNEDILNDHLLIVNATPVGMYPQSEQCPAIPYDAITASHLMYDLIYNPVISEFLRRGREQGAIVKNGLDMLYLQADMSWKIWNDTL